MVISFDSEDLDKLFPAHVRMDREGRIVSVGPSLTSRIGEPVGGRALTEIFDVLRPVRISCAKDLAKHDTRVTLGLKINPNLRVQGVTFAKATDIYFLLGHVPNIDAPGDTMGYRFSDFAPFDGSKDMFLAAQIRKGLLSDAQELVEKLETEKRAAEAAGRAKSQFLGCMSHEIRTPLNGVLGLAALLANSALTEDQSKLLQGITRSGRTLLALLNDIIDISRMDAEQFSIETGHFRLGDMAQSLSDTFESLCHGKSLEFDICLAEDLAKIDFVGDDARITQVLNNLVSNAVKFTAQGMVSVEIFPVEVVDMGPATIQFSIRDTGIGISEEDRAKIFQPFVQADSSITRRFGGTGLGLCICQRLAEMMGGTIWVESSLGEGSSFHMQLPLEEVQSDLRASA